jgi:Flp pilus assembly pilin Flp
MRLQYDFEKPSDPGDEPPSTRQMYAETARHWVALTERSHSMMNRVLGRSKSQHTQSLLLRDERGLSTVEYVILLSVVVIGAIAVWQEIGDKFIKVLGGAKDDINLLHEE